MRRAIFWIGNPHYPVIVFAISLLAGLILRHFKRIQPWLIFPELTGGCPVTNHSLAHKFPCQKIHGKRMNGQENEMRIRASSGILTNATCSFAGAWIFWGLKHFDVADSLALPVGIVVIFVFRVIAVKRHWCFPAVRPAKSRNGGGDSAT